tara:strand:+ start:1096 stop:1323 length:228 start_codon:yes stop_codon:yes gene_type:complete
MSRIRRLRGVLLRFTQRRLLATMSGIVIAAPGIILLFFDYIWETGVTDGLALIVLATGLSLVFIGLMGRQPDWVD